MSSVGQIPNFSDTTPAAPSGRVNVKQQADAPGSAGTVRNFSAYMPPMTGTAEGAVPSPPNDATKYLDGSGHWSKPTGSGGGGGGYQNISYYLSPATITPPDLGSWTWAHQVNATLGVNANGAAVINTFSSGSTAEFIGQSIPAEDFDVIACFAMNPSLISGQQTVCGIALWDSGSGKAVGFELNMSPGSLPQVAVAHYASFTSFTADSYGQNNLSPGMPIWLRINCSFNKYTFYVSVDGQSWDQAYQESTTAYMTSAADHCGILISVHASTPANLVIPHFVIDSFVGS